MMVVIIALLVILLVAIGGVSFFAYRVIASGGLGTGQQNATQQVVPELKPDEVEILKLASPISTDLAIGADGKAHLIRLSLAVGVDNTDKKESPKLIALIVAKETLIRDIALGVIKSKTYEELSRPDGRDILKNEILEHIQATFQNPLLVSILIDDWILS